MKNIRWIILLLFTFSAPVAFGQYADDNVTIFDHRKASDPFKVRKKPSAIDTSNRVQYSLSAINTEEKALTGTTISGIHIINGASDSSILGYVQVGLFNKWMEALPDKPLTEYVQSYVDNRYKSIYKSGASKLVWVIQELRIGERTFNMSEKSYLRLKAMSFAGDSSDTFKLITTLDTVLIRGGLDVTNRHEYNIAAGLQILFNQSLAKLTLTNQKEDTVYTLSSIKEKAIHRYNLPVLQSPVHPDGIYLTFIEFVNDKPSITDVTYSLENNAVRFYQIDSKGNKTFIDKLWGVRKNGILLKQYHNVLIPIEQRQRGIYLTNFLSLSRRNNAVIYGAVVGGAIPVAASGGTSATGILPLVENIPYIRKKEPFATSVDIETGEFAL